MQDLKQRTKKFNRDRIAFCRNIPKSREFDSLVRQLIGSLSSVGANYRANRVKSDKDFINKLKIVEDEAVGSMYGSEIFKEIPSINPSENERPIKEASESVAIPVSSIMTVRKRLQNSWFNNQKPL